MKTVEIGEIVATGSAAGRRRSLFPTAHRLLVERALAKVSFDHVTSVLVVGAGNDPYRSLLPDDARYTSLDIEPSHSGLSVAADAHGLPFVDAAFDCLIASEVLEHLHSPPHFMEEARRVLEPGGMLVGTIPFLFHVHADPSDYQRLTAHGIRRALEEFSDVEVLPFGRRGAVVWDLFTTSFAPRSVFAPLRIANHLLRVFPPSKQLTRSTAPSGYLVKAVR